MIVENISSEFRVQGSELSGLVRVATFFTRNPESGTRDRLFVTDETHEQEQT
jgi:hypothetical protein